jgi:RHS repeat-associated protein
MLPSARRSEADGDSPRFYYECHLGDGNNNNVFAITNNRDHNRDQTFTYDPLNRLISAQNAGTDCTQHTANGKTEYWGNSYGYDAWGNLLQKTITKCGAENMNASADARNWIHAPTGADYQYDAAGNMTYDASGQYYSYDQENRITGAGGYTYTYDADGNRVKKANGNSGTLYWYMSPGIVAESDLNGTLQSEYVFFDGERVARRDGDNGAGGVFYYFSDHLKTASVITDSAGVIKSESDYYPWGGELQFVNSDSNHYKFTGKERDAETGLDYFGARYYSNGLGRFITPDWAATPEPVPYADLDDPQSLNQYSYVRNVPTVNVDLDGHDCATGVCDAPTPTAEELRKIGEALEKLERAAEKAPKVPPGAARAALARAGRIAVAVVVIIGAYASSPFIPTVGQSNADERAAIQQASQERAAQNGGVDPQEAPAPEPAAASGGAMKGGGNKGTGSGTSNGTIYVVPGSGTQSGKPYVGRHNKPNPAQTRRSKDGRDRTKARVVRTYPAGNTQAGRRAEQKEIDKRGLNNLDNKRNEIAK